MEWPRRSKTLTAEEHLRLMDEVESKVLEAHRKLRDEAVTIETLEELNRAYEEYVKLSTEEVEDSPPSIMVG